MGNQLSIFSHPFRTSSSSSATSPSSNETTTFADILILTTQMRQLHLPYDTIQIILSFTDLYIHSIQSDKLYRSVQAANVLYMSSRLLVPRKYRKYIQPSRVVVSVESKDQGWSSHEIPGSRCSHTWGEIAITGYRTNVDEGHQDRRGFELNREFCYRNITAGRNYEMQTIVYDSTSQTLRTIRDNWSDQIINHPSQEIEGIENELDNLEIQLYCRSQYPGW